MCGGAAAGVMAELSEEALLSVLPTIRVPKAGDRVHKDECAFSFDTPVSPFPTPAASTTSPPLPWSFCRGLQGLDHRLPAVHPGTCSLSRYSCRCFGFAGAVV